MAKLIGTAGHVDHGKTTLIRALTGIDADRLPEEKARGMTIDIGFAYLDLPGHGRVSIVDVPGHEKFLRNMLVGALGIDVALLCVAADEAVMPQTREHLQILELLPVDRMVVALTRSDLVDQETLDFARAEVEDLLARTRFQGSPILAVSATNGTGIQELRNELGSALEGQSLHADGPWYLPIDRAFSVKGQGCVVTGTLAQGTAKVGDRALLQPGGTEVRVRGIHTHGDAQESSERGRRTALNLSGVRVEDVHRGMVLGELGAVFETQIFDAKVHWLDKPKHASRVRISIGSEEAIGKVFLNDDDDAVAQFRSENPVAVALNQPLIVRRYSPPDLLGGGRVVIPQSKLRKRGEAARVVETTDPLEAVWSAIGDTLQGTPTEEVCRILGKTPQALGSAFEQLLQSGRVAGFSGLWFQAGSFVRARDQFLEALSALHEASPTQAYVPREKVNARAGFKWSGKPLDRIIASLAADGLVEASGTGVKLPSFRVQLTPRQREFLDRALAELRKEPVNTPGVHELAQALKAPPQAVEEILKLGGQSGEVVAIGQGVYYSVQQLEALKSKVREISGGKPFPASAVRDALQTTRKYAIPLLEYLDSVRFTTRVGDMRVVR